MINYTAKIITAFAFLLLLITLTFTATAQPAGAMSEINLVILEAEGLSFQVFDTNFLDFYAFSNFPESVAEKPQELDRSILVTRYTPVDDVYIQPLDQLIYYPSSDNSGGYVYYVGMLTGTSDYEQKWYRGTPEAEAMIQATFERHEKDLSKMVMISLAAFAGLIFLVLRSVR
jgi:hypothetical protein